MPLKRISFENVKKNTNDDAVYFLLSGDENRYDLLGFYDGRGNFSIPNKFSQTPHYAFIYTDVRTATAPNTVVGGEKRRSRKQRK